MRAKLGYLILYTALALVAHCGDRLRQTASSSMLQKLVCMNAKLSSCLRSLSSSPVICWCRTPTLRARCHHCEFSQRSVHDKLMRQLGKVSVRMRRL